MMLNLDTRVRILDVAAIKAPRPTHTHDGREPWVS